MAERRVLTEFLEKGLEEEEDENEGTHHLQQRKLAHSFSPFRRRWEGFRRGAAHACTLVQPAQRA